MSLFETYGVNETNNDVKGLLGESRDSFSRNFALNKKENYYGYSSTIIFLIVYSTTLSNLL